MANSDNIVNELLGAIDTVIGKRLGQLSYDKTIICTIIDDSKAKNGEYRVTDGSVKFWAKCENTGYHVDDQVRVSVPNGDATQEKFIVGKYVKDNSNTPITYMTPLSSVLQMSGNLCDNNSGTYGLKASGPGADGKPTKTGLLLWSADVTNDNAAMLNSKIYDVIYVQADFKTILSNYNIVSGSYGLVLSLGTTLSSGAAGPPVTCVFDSTQMLGNPYAFGIYTSQAAKFDIKNVGQISSIQLMLYQGGDFLHNTSSLEPVNIPVGDFNNILVKNICVGFGTDVMGIADETVKIFTTDDLRFDNKGADTSNNVKHLKLAWYNKNENGQYLGFDDGRDENGNIKFVDEDEYLGLAGSNAQFKAQQNYDIPLDERGLALATETKEIRDTLLKVSDSLSSDLKTLLMSFKSRCNIASYQDQFDDLISFVVEQSVSVNDKNTLRAAVNDCYDWYIRALNEAAAIYNPPLITSVQGGYSFKGTGINPGTSPAYHTAFLSYFNSVISNFYTDDVFLPGLLELVTGTFSGYKGIYDDFNNRITTLLDQLQTQWTNALDLLSNNPTQIAEYFSGSYTFTPWTEQDLSGYDNGYCVYWYRYRSGAEGDNYTSRGWERVPGTGNNSIEGITVTLDGVNMAKEEFKAIVFFNHEPYESQNTLVFENQSPVVNAATALLSDNILISHSTDSHDAYQSYSVANTLVNRADQFTPRNLTVSFNHADGTADNKALVNAQIYWYVPKESTMLTYDVSDLASLNPDNKFTNDAHDSYEEGDPKPEHYKEGYTCFYKSIGYGLTEEQANNGDYANDLTFCYRIADYYTPTASQNTILCEVVKDGNIYKSEITMTFACFGTSGTDYTLTIAPVGKQAALTNDHEWELAINLYNAKNEAIEIPNLTIEQIVPHSRYSISQDGNKCFVSCGTDTSKALCGILKATVTNIQHSNNDNAVNLTSYFPIPYSSSVDCYIEGANMVIYDSQGANPTYYKDKYQIFRQVQENGSTAVPPGGSWSISYTPGTEDDNWDKISGYMPILSDDKLLPVNMWVDGGNVTYADEDDEGTTHYAYVTYGNGTDVIWSQPILIIQNRYPSPMLNAWDGKLDINEDNGTIMSTMVGAGRKTKNNTFEGVLMGDIEAGAEFNPDNKSGLGIYGFNDGAQSFGFSIDGTAFLGKAGRGRILFDGNTGTIQSSSYSSHYDSGMKIDLDDGFIDMKGALKNPYVSISLVDEDDFNEAKAEHGKLYYPDSALPSGYREAIEWDDEQNYYYKVNDSDNAYEADDEKGSRVHIDIKNPYFYIESKAGNRLLNIGDQNAYEHNLALKDLGYYLKTDDYNPSGWESDDRDWTTGSGMLIDLAAGKIDAYDFTLRGEDPDSRSYLKLSSNPTQMMKVFYVNKEIENDSGLVVFEMGTDNYIMHSFNWWNRIEGGTEPLTGMEFNIRDGKFTAYSSNTAQAGKYIVIDASDDSSNYPLMVGTPGSEALKIAWDGALKINGSAFNVDATGNFWIHGADLNSAVFSVTNEGIVSMKRGSITLGTITKDDGTTSAAFYVDDGGNLTVGGTAFTVNKDGDMTATSGTIGGWKISSTSLKSSNDMMELGSTGTIKIGTYSADSSSGNAFEVTSTGVMKAANYELASGRINTALMMRGKLRVADSGTVSSLTNQTTQFYLKGTALFGGDVYMDQNADFIATYSENDLPVQNSDGDWYYSDGKQGTAFRMQPMVQTNGDGTKVYYNAFYLHGAGTVMWTKYNWIGLTGGETTTYINGNIYINDTSTDGKIHFPHPNNIMAGYYNGVEQTLAEYIARQFTGENAPVQFVANSANLATEALALSQSKGSKYSVGGKTKPVYFSNGIPVECDNYPALSDYATKTWVTNKGYLTSIPSEYITETELNSKGYLTSIPSEYITEIELNNKNYITSSALPDMELYVLKTTYDAKIVELEAKIAALTPST